MRTVALALVVWAAATTMAPAQGWADKMFKEGLVHDFGTVPRGAQLFHKFPITNIYAVRMQITSLTSGCGCVTATASKSLLEPRETAYIEVNMDGRRFVGPKSVNVRVSVGPEFVSTAELRVSAVSRADIVCNPNQINFGGVAAGATPTSSLDVEYAGAFDWQVTGVIANDMPVKVAIKETYRRPGQVGYQLQVTLRDTAPIGALKHEIFLKTNDPATPMVPVLVEAMVQGSIAATPSALTLTGVKVGETLTRRVVVRATKPFVVSAVEGLGNGLALGAELGTNPALVHILTFKLQPDAVGDFKREIQIRTDLQETPIVVTVNGNALE